MIKKQEGTDEPTDDTDAAADDLTDSLFDGGLVLFVGGFGHGIKLDFKLRFDEFGEVEGFFTFEIAED